MANHDVPSPAAQEWLIEALGGLIRSQGYDYFSETPLITASPRDFPDLWTPDAEGASLMIRRILRYAQIEAPVRIQEFDEPFTPALNARGEAHRGVHAGKAAWYAGFNPHFRLRVRRRARSPGRSAAAPTQPLRAREPAPSPLTY